ncbi:hypothetical protein, partial [Mesorhizobium japonicum]|uniref:hypothetical protein n=1 Tax=Mesorhizobium japonicum TaxID=2066070 RepID=UPI003B5AFF4F
ISCAFATVKETATLTIKGYVEPGSCEPEFSKPLVNLEKIDKEKFNGYNTLTVTCTTPRSFSLSFVDNTEPENIGEEFSLGQYNGKSIGQYVLATTTITADSINAKLISSNDKTTWEVSDGWFIPGKFFTLTTDAASLEPAIVSIAKFHIV